MQDGACVDMPLSEAKSLVRRGGSFHIFEHDPETDEQTIEHLADSLESFSPIVGLEPIDDAEYKRGRRPDSLLLDVTGLAHLFGDENQLARQLLLHCESLGYLPRIAVADTVGVAWALARYFAGQYFAQHQQPVVLPPGDRDAIKQLPVESLRLEPVTIDTLYQLGIETIGQLQRLSRNDLAMRFGNAIHRRLDQMTGKVSEPVVARRKPADFISEQLLEHPTNHRETIEVIVARLVTGICEQMRARQQGALQWTVQLACQSGPPLEFRVNLFQPTATTRQVMPLVEMQLEQVLSPHTRKYRKRNRGKPRSIQSSQPKNNQDDQPQSQTENQFHRYTTIQVNEITVSVTSSVLLAQQQRKLFDENPRLDRQSLAHLINRLANRLGTQNVVYPSLQSGAQPEYSFRLRPLVDPRRKHRRRKTKPPRQSHTLARPIRLFHPPLRLHKDGRTQLCKTPGGPRVRQLESAPFSSATPPALLVLETTAKGERPARTDNRPAVSTIGSQKFSNSFATQKITLACGPERIETGWWRGLTVCRDYWRVETETRQQFWIFRDLRSGEWFLHGEF